MRRWKTVAASQWLVWVLVVVGCCAASAKEQASISGTVECDEVRLASRYGGRVVQVFVREGEELPPSTRVVALEAGELVARWRAARAEWEEAVAGPRPEETASAKAEWDALVAELEFARSEQRRWRELYGQSSAAKAELEAAESKATYLEQKANAARKRYELLLAGTRRERLDQARARLDELEALVRELTVMSPPTTSVVEVLNVRVGDVVGANREIATVVLPDALYVRFYVPGPWLGAIERGQSVRVVPDSWPDRAEWGVVEQIARSAEFTPRNVQTVGDRVEQVYAIKVRLPARSALRAGQTVTGDFTGLPPAPPDFRRSGRFRQVRPEP